jgi:hypothetical protein
LLLCLKGVCTCLIYAVAVKQAVLLPRDLWGLCFTDKLHALAYPGSQKHRHTVTS